MHSVRIAEGTILHSILGETAGVNTSHHQAVKDVAPGFVISAVSEDGVVEAIEKSDAECIIGVQFHPEAFVAEGNDSLLPVFTHLIRSATSR
jgi:putative glutamine amidotransferase